MLNELDPRRPPVEQLRDARDLLTRLYREIGISAVAAALEVRKEQPQPSRPAAAVLQATEFTPPADHIRAA